MATKSILVVEDEAIIASDIKHTLKSLGYDVAGVARTGADAVAQAEELHPDLILMDIVLSGAMTGIEAAEAIRTRLDIPLIYLTAFADDATLQRAKGTDPFGYVLKPFGDRELQVAIDMALYKHQSARQLRESEQRFRDLFELAPLGYLSLSADGRVLAVNQAWLDSMGYTREQVIGRQFSDFLWPDSSSHGHVHQKDPCSPPGPGGEVTGLGLDLVRGDGSRVSVSIDGRSSVDADDTRRQTHCIMHDVTEKRRAERALQESEDRFRRLVELSPDAIMVHVDGKIAFINETGARLFGAQSPDELLGMALLDRIHPNYRSIVAERLHVLCDLHGDVPRLEEQYLRLDGSTVDVEVLSSPFTFQGRPGAQILARDISGRKQREREMAAVASLSAALRNASTGAEMMPIIMDQVLTLMQADGGLVVLRDQTTRELVLALGQGAWAWVTGRRLRPDAGVTARVMDTHVPYCNAATPEDAGLAHPDLLGDLVATTCVPLIVQGESIGAMWIGFRPEAGRRLLSDGELRVLVALADIAASAIHRSALHEETQRRLEHITSLHTIDTAISSSLDLRVTLDVLLSQVTSQLQVDGASVMLFSNAAQTLSHAAARGYQAGALTRIRLRLGEGSAGRAARERTTICCPDLREAVDADPRARLLAAEGFISAYSVPLVAKGQVKGILEVYHKQTLNPDQEWQEFLVTLAGQAAIAVENAELYDQLQLSNSELAMAYESTLEGWSKALDLRDQETEGHTLRSADLTVRLAQAVGVCPQDLVHVRRGALLHDIGKMGIPDSILLKPGPLTPEEWKVMQRHPLYAYEMLAPITYLRQALEIPYSHHEKWDGTGYPRGLKGEQIPLAARIFAVVDVWDALTCDRPYRPAWPADKARQYIEEQVGKHFDPQVARAFMTVLDRER